MMMDPTMLLPPTNTPLTGIDFTRRLPCGEHEKARVALRVFFAMRMLSQQLSGEKEDVLPLSSTENSVKTGDVVDTSESAV
jgi:protein CLEC16A